jgi:hypothetical protein
VERGFIRLVHNRRAVLLDKSGVPVRVSDCVHLEFPSFAACHLLAAQ